MTPISWMPDRPTSKGASAYHSAVVKTSWHKKNISEMLKIMKKKIYPSRIIVDFGAGTGASSVYIRKILPRNCQLVLVDNSPSWLGKAYDILHTKKNISFLLLEKKKNRYQSLHELLGEKVVDHVLCANTVHLIPDIEGTFAGIYSALKVGGSFTFQSGNIKHVQQKEAMLIEDSVRHIHDLAIRIIKNDPQFFSYRKYLVKRIKEEAMQRKFVFPDPRPISFYSKALKKVGFKNIVVSHVPVKVLYADWLRFLKVRRLQAGILPEIGGKDASLQEERDRDVIITQAAQLFFTQLKATNTLATKRSFSAEWTYVQAEK